MDLICCNSKEDDSKEKKGLSYQQAAFFNIAAVAGAGFLALPSAFLNVGWTGIPLTVVIVVVAGFTSYWVGSSWIILEERWPEHYVGVNRQPYVEIVDRAYGNVLRKIALACVLLTLIGIEIVYSILIADFLFVFTDISTCIWLVILTIILIPVSLFGSPADFWIIPVFAVVSTAIACIIIVIELILDRNHFPDPVYPTPTLSTYAAGFSTILFSTLATYTFPTIQNDMKDRTQVKQAIVLTFTVILALYLPVAITGYAIMGEHTPSNILLYKDDITVELFVAIAFQMVNLIATFIVLFNPLAQMAEELFNVPKKFGWRRIILRICILLLQLLVALSLPGFELVLNFVGGFITPFACLLLPPLMYKKFCDDKSNPEWPLRKIPLWERILIYEVILVAIVGGVIATAFAVYALIQGLTSSCLTNLFSD